MRSFGVLLARLFVKLRFVVIVAWIAGTAYAGVTLPSIGSGSGGSLGELVPNNAPALKAERISAGRFAFPLLTRTVVVVRNPHGLPKRRQQELARLAAALTLKRLPGFTDIAAAIPLVNTLGTTPFTRNPGTTALLYLYFRSNQDAYARTSAARRLVAREIGHQPGEFEGVTGESPARVARTETIGTYLKWVELATIVLVALALAIHFGAVGAAAVTMVAIGLAYELTDRLVAEFGKLAGVSVPQEIQPVLVVLIFGVVTDYSIFFLSRFRTLLATGQDPRSAAVEVVRRISPIVVTAGIAVAAGTSSLVVAHLVFLRAFGPGLAIAVALAMIVAVTFVPAALAVGGNALFWPRGPEPADADRAEASSPQQQEVRRTAAVRFATRHRIAAILVSCLFVGGAASGLSRINLGNDLIRGLPTSGNVERADNAITAGFVPGMIAPTLVLVTGPDLSQRITALDRFQHLLARQPDVAQIVGAAQAPVANGYGLAISHVGNAARFAVFLASNPLDARAIADVRALRGRLPTLLREAGLPGATAVVAGDTALSAETIDATLTDLGRVAPVLLVAVFVVLTLFLRALVAPALLILTSGLASLAALGLTVYVFQLLLGYGQITYYVIFVVSVLLVSLGSDYNVFLIGRVWQEGRRRPLRQAIEVAGSRAARPIMTAGFVLAASFALLAIVPIRSFREIAFAMGIGLLIDAFIVRAILVPALLSLVGPVAAWPGHAIKRRTARRPTPAPQARRPPRADARRFG